MASPRTLTLPHPDPRGEAKGGGGGRRAVVDSLTVSFVLREGGRNQAPGRVRRGLPEEGP